MYFCLKIIYSYGKIKRKIDAVFPYYSCMDGRKGVYVKQNPCFAQLIPVINPPVNGFL